MPHPTHPDQHHRPLWLLLTIALPVGMMLNWLFGGVPNLRDALLMLMGWQADPTLLQRYAAGLVSHLVVPALLVLMLLKLTRLGDWLAPSRLALAGLLLANALLFGMAARGLWLASTDSPPFVSGWLNDVLTPVMVLALCLGLGALAAVTVWRRLVTNKRQAVRLWRHLLREV